MSYYKREQVSKKIWVNRPKLTAMHINTKTLNIKALNLCSNK